MLRRGTSFQDREVARLYALRPAYPFEVFACLSGLVRPTARVLDLGCGTGKLSLGLAAAGARVTAVDTSLAMLEVAQQDPRASRGITWVRGAAESAALPGGPFDLVVAGASIHWMTHSVLFPRLLGLCTPQAIFATVDGDGAFNPPWRDEWDRFMAHWIERVKGEPYAPEDPDARFQRHMRRHLAWMDVMGEVAYVQQVAHSLEDFVALQHSRETFAPAHLGDDLLAFDEQLHSLLAAHAVDGQLHYKVQTRIEWGSLRSAAKMD